jgi:nucleoside-diphosphate-sugar epimerase
MKKILLLGGGGYIGSKFYHKYNNIYDITSIDLKLFSYDNYSISMNYNNINNIHDYDIIICLAGHSSVQMCEYSPSRSWINNVEYFKNLCHKINNEQILIYMSSASVYGNSSNICTEEQDFNINPIQEYDLHKILIDIIANKYIIQDKRIIGLRLGTVNGSSPHTRRELMLNSMTINAIENGFIKIKNLNMKRSILGINDLMRAIDIIINNNISPGQYNLCSFTMSVAELANEVYKKISTKIIEEPSDNIFYSFEMSTDKFCKSCDFTFKDTASSIINELINNHNSAYYSVRNNDGNFKSYL